jgi:hypothetical protein|tara:strand:- start:385 stop:741 length:357 start_codon:yes stop_codon:yes gene_type:complete
MVHIPLVIGREQVITLKKHRVHPGSVLDQPPYYIMYLTRWFVVGTYDEALLATVTDISAVGPAQLGAPLPVMRPAESAPYQLLGAVSQGTHRAGLNTFHADVAEGLDAEVYRLVLCHR